MRSMHQTMLAAAGVLVCGWVGAADVQMPSLGNCVAAFGEESELAVKACKAKRARALLKPGSSACPTLSRVERSSIHCSQSDAATGGVRSATRFKRFYATLNAPLTIGSPEEFYRGQRAGQNDRFEIVEHNDGKIKIRDNNDDDRSCIVPANTTWCERRGAFSSGQSVRLRHGNVYTMRLDGLLVENHFQRSSCTQSWSGYCLRFETSSPRDHYAVLPVEQMKRSEPYTADGSTRMLRLGESHIKNAPAGTLEAYFFSSPRCRKMLSFVCESAERSLSEPWVRAEESPGSAGQGAR